MTEQAYPHRPDDPFEHNAHAALADVPFEPDTEVDPPQDDETDEDFPVGKG